MRKTTDAARTLELIIIANDERCDLCQRHRQQRIFRGHFNRGQKIVVAELPAEHRARELLTFQFGNRPRVMGVTGVQRVIESSRDITIGPSVKSRNPMNHGEMKSQPVRSVLLSIEPSFWRCPKNHAMPATARTIATAALPTSVQFISGNSWLLSGELISRSQRDFRFLAACLGRFLIPNARQFAPIFVSKEIDEFCSGGSWAITRERSDRERTCECSGIPPRNVTSRHGFERRDGQAELGHRLAVLLRR